MTVASYFPFSLNLTKLLRVVKSVFVTCDSNIRSEGKYFPHIFFNLLSKNLILTAFNLKGGFNPVGSVAELGREHKFISPALFLLLQYFFQTLCDYSVIQKYSLFHLTAESRVTSHVKFLPGKLTLVQIYSFCNWVYR